MPQPKNAEPTEPEVSAEATAGQPYLGDPDAPVGSPAWLIHQAHEHERTRAGVMQRLGAVRDQLRNLDKLGALSDAEGEWLDAFFPLKEKGERRSKEDIERTRKAKLAARQTAAA